MGYLAAIAAFLLWSVTSSILVRIIPLPGPVVTCAGCAVGAAGMLAFLGPGRRRELVEAHRRHFWRLMAMGAAFAGCSLTYQWAIKTTTIANAVLTHSVQPILTCLVFLPLAGRGTPSRREFAALALGIVGLAVLLWPGLSLDGPLFGIALGLASAAFFSWFNVLMPTMDGKIGRDVLQTSNLLASTAMLAPFALAQDVPRPTAAHAGLLVLFGLLTFIVANRLYYFAMRRAPVGHVATLAYLEPVVAIAAAALWLGEPITLHAVVGGALVLAAGALVVFGRRPERKTAP